MKTYVVTVGVCTAASMVYKGYFDFAGFSFFLGTLFTVIAIKTRMIQ